MSGLPVRFVLSPGQASDKTTVPHLLEGMSLSGDVVGDRGYFAKAVIAFIQERGATAHIPSQSNVRVRHSVEPELYRKRNLVERFFNRLKHFRAIATRYHKLARNFLAAIALAAVRLHVRHYESTT